MCCQTLSASAKWDHLPFALVCFRMVVQAHRLFTGNSCRCTHQTKTFTLHTALAGPRRFIWSAECTTAAFRESAEMCQMRESSQAEFALVDSPCLPPTGWRLLPAYLLTVSWLSEGQGQVKGCFPVGCTSTTSPSAVELA